MMKPCHALTKYEPTLPRPFSRAFHPINLVAAEVTRLKLHRTARFDHLPGFVPTEINLIRPNPAKSGQKTGKTACRHNGEHTRPGCRFPRPRGKPFAPGCIKRSCKIRAHCCDSKGAFSHAPNLRRHVAHLCSSVSICGSSLPPFSCHHNPLIINRVKPSQTQSNHAYWGGDSLSPQSSELPIASALQIEAEQSRQNPRRAPAQIDTLVNRISYIVNAAVKPSQTMPIGVATTCRHNIPRCRLVPQLCLKNDPPDPSDPSNRSNFA